MKAWLVALVLVLMSGCGSHSGSPAQSAPQSTSGGPTHAVYFTTADGSSGAAVAREIMGRSVPVEVAPGPGTLPAGQDGTVRAQLYLMPVAAGGEAQALARFRKSPAVASAYLGRYPPALPS